MIQKEFLMLDSSGNPVTQAIISITDASGNLVTGENLKCSFVKIKFIIITNDILLEVYAIKFWIEMLLILHLLYE